MKLNHTPLGAVASKKKVLFGTLALALVGGVTPALVNNSYADVIEPDDKPEAMYTVVGPSYFTYVDLWSEDGETYRIADTSIANFYQYDDSGYSPKVAASKATPVRGVSTHHGPIYPYYCNYEYTCIQGKKTGTTEILVEKDGEVIDRMPLTSVRLNTNANIMISKGETISGTGAIEGADNSLLHLVDTGARDGSAAVITGDRSYTVISSGNTYIYNDLAYLLWQVGDQLVGGGTFFTSLNVNAVDNVYRSAENEALLTNALKNIYTKIFESNVLRDKQIFDIVADDGSIAHFELPNSDDYYDPDRIMVSLDVDTTKPAEVTKDELTSELPDGTKGIKFTNVKANICSCYKEGGSVAQLNSTAYGGGMGGEISAGSEDEETCIREGEITKLGQDLDMAISVENVAGVKAGYARKWYVTRDNNGVIERIEATYDEETKTIHFKSNGFGFYAYGYVDEKINNVPGVPNTGIAPQKIIATAAVTITPLIVIAFVSFTVREKNRRANKLAKKHNHFE